MNRSSTTRNPRSRVPTFAGVLLAAWLTACGGGAEVLFVPYFVFGFEDTTADPIVSVFLKNSDDCTTSGNFPAEANISVGASQTSLTGSYDGRTLVITLGAALGDYTGTYDGRFQDRDTIVFTPKPGEVGKALTVRRIDVGVPLQTCPA
jgi:hypothetical protein